jgi:methylenetetrahydrofolate--tRNA-(uracil-5-)-methyltransferase
MIHRPLCYFAGQMTGVEGYVESAGSGMVAGISLARQLLGKNPVSLPSLTALGAMGKYISTPNARFQPMNCAFGLIDPLPPEPGKKKMDKQARYEKISARSLAYLKTLDL